MDGSRRDSCLDVVFLWNLFVLLSFFFFNDTATTEIYTLSLHDALPIYCTLLLDVPVAVGLARARGRAGSSADRFEAEVEAFFERVRAGYLEQAAREPRRIRVIDAAATLAGVEGQVIQILQGFV